MDRFRKTNLPAYLNFLLAKYEAYTGQVQVASTPYYAMVDACDACQLRCPTCPTGIQNQGRGGPNEADTHYRDARTILKPDLFDAFLDETSEKLFMLTLHSWGEPLLNRHLASYVRKATDREIETHIHTNLSLQISEQRMEELLAAGLDTMFASVDGFSQEAYEKFRIGGDIELVKRNLELAARVRDRLGLQTEIIYKFLVFSWNEHEEELAKAFCARTGIAYLPQDPIVGDASWLPSYRKDEQPFLSIEDVEELDRQWAAAGKPDYWKEHEKHPYWWAVGPGQRWIPVEGRQVGEFCGWHYSTAVSNPRGDLAPCCVTAKDVDNFGTIEPGGCQVSDVWNNKQYQKARAVFAGREVPELEVVDTVCDRCYFPDPFKQSFSNNDVKVLAQFRRLFGGQNPQLDQAFEILANGENGPNRARYVQFFEQNLQYLLTGADSAAEGGPPPDFDTRAR